ncbi:MAG: hypothetical protein AB7F76_05810 [Parvibaculaceae bacterium]
MRKASLLVSGFLLAAAVPAHASGALMCDSLDKKASISVGMGHLPVVGVLGIDIEANGKRWSTTKGKDVIPIANGQAFGSDEQFYFDITDDNIEGVIAKLRVLFGRAEDVEAEPVFAGYLSIKGEGVWPVICSTE